MERTTDATVLAGSPRGSLGQWAIRLETAAAKAWIRTYALGVRRDGLPPGEYGGTMEGDVVFLQDKLDVQILTDCMAAHGRRVRSDHPLIWGASITP